MDLVFFIVGLIFLIMSLVFAAFPQMTKRSRHYKRTKDKIKRPVDVLKYNGYQIIYPLVMAISLFFFYTEPLKLAGAGMAIISMLIYLTVLFRDYFNSIEEKQVENRQDAESVHTNNCL